ncbi:MAG TPA: ketoacyl-ACP synthase III [Pyrinomonadaceae bacterium]|jgi:3-oxoacyl-[acyl-carrier-protein] synthase-3|nr:ketoacyl-ACP synthase III [Pyrinomonadaceae bacterium]
MTQRAALTAIKSFLPENKLTNEQLAEQFGDWHASQILSKTGVAVRGVAGPDECASDLGVKAAQRLFESRVCAPEEIDFLIFCTQSPDYFTPTTACVMQNALGLPTSCGAVDINQGCSGYIYGLALAKSLVEAGTARTVLLVTADTYMKFINRRDRSLLTLFGDGAAATLLRAVESERELVGPFVLGSDGRGANQIIVKAGGLRRRTSAETSVEREDSAGNWRSDENLFMDGADVFSFALRTVPPTLQQLLEKSGMKLDEIDFIVPHQANKFVLERLRAKLKFPAEKFWIDMEDSGNTVSSTIPIALEKALGQGRVKSGDRVALVGFGVGYSWGATLVEIR